MVGALLRLVLTTAAVLVVLLLITKYLKRRGVGQTVSGHTIAVSARYPTGKGSALLVVHAGTRVLLIGQAPGGFTALAELDSESVTVPTNAINPGNPGNPGNPIGLGVDEVSEATETSEVSAGVPVGLVPRDVIGWVRHIISQRRSASLPVTLLATEVVSESIPAVPGAATVERFDLMLGAEMPAALRLPTSRHEPMSAKLIGSEASVSVEQLDDNDLHRVLLEVDARTVLIAIKGAPSEFAERVGNCFVGGDSDRRAALVSCAVNLAGKSFPELAVRDARRQIAAKARSLVAFGEITVRPDHGAGDTFAALFAAAGEK